MSKSNGIEKTVCLAAMLGLLSVLAGCGGGDDNKKAKNENNCFDNPVNFFFCVATASGDSSGAQSKAGDASVASNLQAVGEYEPNNILNNANVVSLPLANSNTATGLRFEGSVDASDDAADFFIFTPSRSGKHTILLCGETCEAGIEDDSAYIMIYDHNQTTIAATPIGTVASQEVTAELTAGMAYYVEINGYNAGAANYEYRLAVLN